MTAPVLSHNFTLPMPFPVPAAQLFAALVEPAQLERWLCNHASVDLSAQRYHFHGPAVLGAPTAPAQQLVSVEPGASLRFRWSLHGVATEVTYRVSPEDKDAQKSHLQITHDVFGELPFASPRHAIDDWWRLATGNLMSHLEDNGHAVLPDFTRDTAEVVVSIEIAAPPAKVFRTLLDPALMTRWLGTVARVDRATGEYSYGFKYEVEGKTVHGGPTRILELVPDEKLVTDWPDWRGDDTKPKTHVTWALAALPPDGKRTRLTLTHAGFAHPVDRSDYQQGWWYFLEQLRSVSESPEGASETGAVTP